MAFSRIPRREGYIVAIFGAITGYYIWNQPLKQFAEKNFSNTDLNKVSFLYYEKTNEIILKINN